jgi:hypothetical protein
VNIDVSAFVFNFQHLYPTVFVTIQAKKPDDGVAEL